MEPMKPMQPMKPMAPMKPMDSGPQWWPDGLGQPNSSGSQNGVRYAFFARARRLAIEIDGQVAVYDSGDHEIGGVSQQQGGGRPLAFSSQNADVMVDELKQV
jgi:hypothetical protein